MKSITKILVRESIEGAQTKKGEKIMKRKKLTFIKSFLLLVLITVMALSGCNGSNDGNDTYETDYNDIMEADHGNALENDSADFQEIGGLGTEGEGSIALFPEIGEGENTFLFEVVTDEDMSYFWVVSTDKTTVGEALLELDLIRGEESEFGFFVTEINGLVADFDADGTFWAFYVDGEFAMEGVMDTEIEPDTTYAFVFTEG